MFAAAAVRPASSAATNAPEAFRSRAVCRPKRCAVAVSTTPISECWPVFWIDPSHPGGLLVGFQMVLARLLPRAMPRAAASIDAAQGCRSGAHSCGDGGWVSGAGVWQYG